MTQFHAGQDVEVRKIADGMNEMHWSWRKAKVVNDDCIARKDGLHCYLVQFPDGTRAIFDDGHIRAIGTGTYETMARGPHAKVNGLEI
jgi:hypothetical protein